jgi:filamentous hemagglutinin
MLIGHGTVTLTDSLQTGGALISGGSGSTLINSSTIQGSGEIGHSAGMALINESGGVINANQPRLEKSLLVSFPAGITNQGLMEATGTGLIIFGTTINNSGGAITASGGSIVLNSGVIEGGTLTASSDSSMQNMGVLKSSNGGVLTLSGLTNLKTIQTQGNGSKVLVPGTITNYGNFSVGCGTLFEITGTFTNFFGTTLVGGHYSVCGKLQFTGANVVNNEAYITLTGASSAIVDQANNDGLRNLASTGSGYSLSLTSGRDTTTPGSYSNSGTLAVDRKTKFTVNGSYTQTQVNQKIPKTKVDGVLTVPSGTTIQRGSLLGIGSIASTVVSSGSVTAGDTATKPGILSLSTYTQNSGNLSMLNIAIGGLNVGAQYSQLAVLNGASLNGPLNITRINGFVPAIGNTFTILTASAVIGTFSTVNGLSINSSEHFTITYNPTNVTLTVVPGP